MSYHPAKFNVSLIAASLAMAHMSFNAFASASQAIEKIEVSGQAKTRTEARINVVQQELAQVAGGSNLIDLSELQGRQATLQDALGFAPGVMMQSFFGGNDQPRLNIRGSGVQSNPVNRGIQLLDNGLPLNQADGSFIIGLVDTKSADLISVYRGANGLRYGATTLGGAINFISKNGEAAPAARLEYGSDNRTGLYGQYGIAEDDHDVFVSVSSDKYDGYRHHSGSERSSLLANFGIELTEYVQNRTFVQWTDSQFDIPFVVPKARAIADPKQILGDGDTPLDKLLNVYQRHPHRDSQLMRVSNKTAFNYGATQHDIGVYYQQVDDTFADPLKHSITDSIDMGIEYALHHHNQVLSNNDQWLIAVSVNQSNLERQYRATHGQTGALLPQFAMLDLTASNQIVALQWHAEITEQWQLVSALQWVNSDRDIIERFPSGETYNNHYQYLNPKLGLNFQALDSIRLYANVSQTAEAPTFWELVEANVSPKNAQVARVKINSLSEQSSTTFELGSQGSASVFQWDISVYRSLIEDEIISVVSDFAVNGETINYADDTVHQGIEAQLNACLGHDLFSTADRLDLKWVHNYNDFYFAGGKYEGNQIAGLPKHSSQFELAYQTANGFYVAPSIQWQPQDTPIDHANTQFQDAFTLVSLKMAYQVNKSLNIYADIENLTDRVYQSSYVIRGLSKSSQPSFLPGIGRSISIGMNYQW